MSSKKQILNKYTCALIVVVSSWTFACDNKKDESLNTIENRVDSLGQDTSIQNVDVHVPADNTIAKDSASNREDLGGGSK